MCFKLKTYFNKNTHAAPLAIFRLAFGCMMCFSIIRFWYHGWIEKLYIQPKFHFSYYGFEWVKPLGNYTYFFFLVCGLAALCVALGLKYRVAITVFFLSFTYIELMDKTTYLNHYYFISLLAFLMIFLPANAYFSVDNLLKKRQYELVPKWTIDSIKLLLCIVYFYAGLAKINSDWLLRAQPLKIWLTSKYDLPFIGESLMHKAWFHFAMSWGGMLYDLSIPFLLLYRKTRVMAFILVVFFHVFTRVLFPIGMFPFIMIVSALIFFDAGFHKTCIANLQRVLWRFVPRLRLLCAINYRGSYPLAFKKPIVVVLAVFFCVQFLLPFRYLLYPGELFWTEQGYRFSWRVMLMEKMGISTFKIVNGKTGDFFYVDNSDFLTPFQEKQMAFQPDFILEYAHYLGDHFTSQGHENVAVYVESYVALNGRLSAPYIDKTVNLYAENESFKPKHWILPFYDDIKGL